MMTDATPAARVAEAWREAAADAATTPSLRLRPVAIGWATVELDRATVELAAALGLGGDEPFRRAPRSAALGAAARVAGGVLPDGGSLVVLEPDTEGRLAGSLARLGEGPVAVWLVTDGPDVAHQAGPPTSPAGDGPFGREHLIVNGPDRGRGRHRLLVARPAGTIPP